MKWLFQIKNDGRIGGKYTCVQLIAINKELSNCLTTVLFLLVWGEKNWTFYLDKDKDGDEDEDEDEDEDKDGTVNTAQFAAHGPAERSLKREDED